MGCHVLSCFPCMRFMFPCQSRHNTNRAGLRLMRNAAAPGPRAAGGGRIDARAPSGTMGDVRRFLLAVIGARLRFELGFRVFRRCLPSSCFGHGSLLPAPLPFPSPRRWPARAADPDSRVMCAGARARQRAFRGGANRAPDCPRARGLNAGARLPSVPKGLFCAGAGADGEAVSGCRFYPILSQNFPLSNHIEKYY